MILVLTVHVGTDKVDVGLSARAIDVEVFEIAAHFGSHRGVDFELGSQVPMVDVGIGISR